MIEAEQLTKRFDGFTAVDEVSLSVDSGELLALLGPNGAGKTTTVRMLSAILKPTEGTARINGFDVVIQADQVRRQVGMLTEQPGLYSRSNGLEYLLFFGRLYGLDDDVIRQRGLHLFDRFGMPEKAAYRRLGEYSKGMRQKVGIIRAMLHRPTVLLLDEPTSAMDPHSAKLVRDAILELRDNRRAILVCTHNLAEAELLADRIAVIRQGRIIAQDKPAILKRQLLGRRRFEVRLDQPFNGELDGLGNLVTVESTDDLAIRYLTDQPQKVNPQVIRCLDNLGFGTVTLTEISASLEDVYLNLVNDQSLSREEKVDTQILDVEGDTV
jgi:ABC-2 type transport system ATP-binding protein